MPIPNGMPKSVQPVDRFRSDHPDIPLNYIVNQTNQGSAKTRNIGIDAARGEYITFLDDDDIYLPDKVKNQVEFMIAGCYDYSVTDLILYNENGKETDRRIRDYIKDTSSESLRLYHLRHHMTGTDTMMYRKDYLLKIGGFAPIDAGDEFYLMMRAIDGGGSFGYLPGCEIKAYVHTGENGLSCGDVKVNGEHALYKFKKQYFHLLDHKTRRFIKMRYLAVVAYAELKRKRYFAFFAYAFRSFLCAPIACVKLLFKR